jgi:hypothetical protein
LSKDQLPFDAHGISIVSIFRGLILRQGIDSRHLLS